MTVFSSLSPFFAVLIIVGRSDFCVCCWSASWVPFTKEWYTHGCDPHRENSHTSSHIVPSSCLWGGGGFTSGAPYGPSRKSNASTWWGLTFTRAHGHPGDDARADLKICTPEQRFSLLYASLLQCRRFNIVVGYLNTMSLPWPAGSLTDEGESLTTEGLQILHNGLGWGALHSCTAAVREGAREGKGGLATRRREGSGSISQHTC